MPDTTALEVRHLTAGYRPGLPIVRDVSITARAGEVVTIMGPNGAGKSTLVKAIARLLHVDTGDISVGGQSLLQAPAHALAAHGVAYVPQSGNVFTQLSVRQNLELSAGRIPRGAARSRRTAVDDAMTRFPALGEKRQQRAGELSGGQRQLLAVAMALLIGPRVLLMDEPTAGLSPSNATATLDLLRSIADAGAAVLLVEQNVRAGLHVSDRGYVLADGRNQLEARASELLDDPAVADLYLGGRPQK